MNIDPPQSTAQSPILSPCQITSLVFNSYKFEDTVLGKHLRRGFYEEKCHGTLFASEEHMENPTLLFKTVSQTFLKKDILTGVPGQVKLALTGFPGSNSICGMIYHT